MDFWRPAGGMTPHAEIHYLPNAAVVSANDPRPPAQAVKALSEEYAWVIDFEAPPYYGDSDLVDDTAYRSTPGGFQPHAFCILIIL
jgi:hypothetical protein